jgi:hypothetical protein
MSGVTIAARRMRSMDRGRRTLAWLNSAVALSSTSKTTTATAGAPSAAITAILMNSDSAISRGWKRTPLVTSRSTSV